MRLDQTQFALDVSSSSIKALRPTDLEVNQSNGGIQYHLHLLSQVIHLNKKWFLEDWIKIDLSKTPDQTCTLTNSSKTRSSLSVVNTKKLNSNYY